MQSAASSAPDKNLVRAIGLRALTASIINVTVGAGIFVLPAAVTGRMGTAAPFAYLVCAITMALIVSCFAIAGSRVSLTGGLYAYVEVAFGPYVGFLAGVLLWLSCVLAVAGILSALAVSLAAQVPVLSGGIGRATFIVTVVALLAWMNVRGVRPAARLVEWLTLAKLLPLAVFVLVGIFFVRPEHAFLISLPEADALGNTVLLLIFAFIGVEVALVPSGEVLNPARNVPAAIFLALGATTLLYLATQFVADGVLGADLAAAADAPLVAAASRFLGGAGQSLLLAGMAVSMLGYASGDMLGAPRLLFAFGREGLLPGIFTRVHPRFRTPHIAIVAHATLVTGMALIGSFGSLVLLSNIATLVLYLFCCAGAWELTRRNVGAGGTPFRVPAGPLIPILACAAILWILSHVTRGELAALAVTLAVATGLFLFRPRSWRQRQS